MGPPQLVARNVVTVDYVDARVRWWKIFIEAERSVASLYRGLEKTETYFALKSELINDNSCTRS